MQTVTPTIATLEAAVRRASSLSDAWDMREALSCLAPSLSDVAEDASSERAWTLLGTVERVCGGLDADGAGSVVWARETLLRAL